MDREAWQAIVYGVTRVRYNLATKPPPYTLPQFHCFLLHSLKEKTNFISFNNIIYTCLPFWDFPDGLDGKESTCNAGDLVQSLGWEDSLEKGMATHSSILAWRIPWTEKPGRLQFMGSQRARQDGQLSLSAP